MRKLAVVAVNKSIVLLVMLLALCSFAYGITEEIRQFNETEEQFNLNFTNDYLQRTFFMTTPRYLKVNNFSMYFNPLYNHSGDTRALAVDHGYINVTGYESVFTLLRDLQKFANSSTVIQYGTGGHYVASLVYNVSFLDVPVTNKYVQWRISWHSQLTNFSMKVYNYSSQTWNNIFFGNTFATECVNFTTPISIGYMENTTDNKTLTLNLTYDRNSGGGEAAVCDGLSIAGGNKAFINNTWSFDNNPANFKIIVGTNDNIMDYNKSGIFNTSVNVSINASTWNNIINNSCSCVGCNLTQYYCTIPVHFFSTKYGGTNVSFINLSYEWGIDDCTTFNTQSLNFSLYEENNRTNLNADVMGTFSFYNDPANVFNYTYNKTNIQNFQLCLYPPNSNYTIDAYLQYETVNDKGKLERYYLENVNMNNVSSDIFLYNFENTAGLSDLKAILYNYYYDEYKDVIMKMQRYYPALNSWITVQVDKSDEFGVGIFYVYQDTVDYRFVWEQEGTALGTTQSLKFICDEVNYCEQTFTVLEADPDSSYSGMTYTDLYNNETGIYSFTWADTNGLVSDVRLVVQQIKSNNIIDICDTTVASSSGTINCNITGYTGTIQVRAIRSASPDDPFYSRFLDLAAAALKDILNTEGYRNDGIFLGFLVLSTFVGFGAAIGSSIMVVIMGVAGLIFLSFFQMGGILTYSILIGIVFVGVVVAFMVKN